MKSEAWVIGPIPPPIDGRAIATEWLVRRLREQGDIRVIDTQFEGGLAPIRKLGRCARTAVQIAATGPQTTVIVASAGLGLLAELLPLFAARIRRRRALLVHHSARYIKKRSLAMACAVRIGGPGLTHVALSEEMRLSLCERYSLDPAKQAVVINNAGLMPDIGELTVDRHARLVHLSNLSREKGTLVAIEVARRLADACGPIVLRLVGSADAETRRSIDLAIMKGASLEHVGQLEGQAKLAELASSRAMLFPTSYQHEAQPLVVLEAAAVGTVPIVWDKGWVREQMRDLGLEQFVFEVGDVEGMTKACEAVLSMTDDEFELVAARVKGAYLLHAERTNGHADHILG